MSWSATPEDRSGGRRRRARRGPRWVTDHAREIAKQAPHDDHARQHGSRRSGSASSSGGFGSPSTSPGFDDPRGRGRNAAQPARRAERWERPDPPRYTAAEPETTRYDGPTGARHEDQRGWRDRPGPRAYDDRGGYGGYEHDDDDGYGYGPNRRWQPPADRNEPSAERHGPRAERYEPRAERHEPRTERREPPTERRDQRDVPERPTHLHETADTPGGGGPRKLTVTRVAAWRSRQLTQSGIAAFRRAATADGADRSGLTALTFPVMASFAADAAVAVALANTLFFSAATAESKTKVALYLLITVAPFALVAPVIGPLLDRLQRGRRTALAASFVGRGLLAIIMARHFGDWLLYPAALGSMVLSRSFGLLKAATTPRVLPPEMTLTKVNSRLAVFGLAAGGVVGGIAAGFAWAFGSAGALYFTTVVCVAGAWLCLRIPAWVEVTEGEVPASLRDQGDEEPVRERRRREPLSRHVVVALWGNGTIRILTGFLTLFVAFVVKAQTEHSPWEQLVLLGMVGAAAGIGNITGNSLGARQHFGKPDQVILTCVGIVLGASILAALMAGIATAVVVGLVGSTCSSLAKVCQDAVIQRDMSQESVASAFGRTETILQLSWTFGGALGVLLPPTYWLGFTVVSVLLALGTAQTVMAHRGGSLLPGFGRRLPRPGPARQWQRP